MSTAEKSERPERDQDLRCQSGPSAKDSVIFSGGDYTVHFASLMDMCHLKNAELEAKHQK